MIRHHAPTEPVTRPMRVSPAAERAYALHVACARDQTQRERVLARHRARIARWERAGDACISIAPVFNGLCFTITIGGLVAVAVERKGYAGIAWVVGPMFAALGFLILSVACTAVAQWLRIRGPYQ